ncbi:MAG TPA: DUF4126 domain-containing protein [Ignavibacteria bacterium]|nr:DUF4126 domain-containing protein [Ignavibacteria bacterium]
MDIAIGICLGLGLAASCGFRVFVPLLISNIASMTGIVNIGGGFEWMGSWPAFAIFLTATVAEIGAYYIPVLDNALDTISVPLATIAGTLLSVTFITDVPPMVQWTLGIIVGGGSAAVIKSGASMARLKSTAFTAGWANWLLATFEHITSFVMSVLTVLLPIVMGVIALGVLGFFGWRLTVKRPIPKKNHDSRIKG